MHSGVDVLIDRDAHEFTEGDALTLDVPGHELVELRGHPDLPRRRGLAVITQTGTPDRQPGRVLDPVRSLSCEERGGRLR